MYRFISAVFIAFLFSGCSTVTSWEPVLNSSPDKNVSSQEKDVTECKELALKAAGYLKDGVVDALAAGAGGAAEGAVIGALVGGAGGAGAAAAAGAPIGAIAGLWWGEYEADLTFRRSFSNCLYQRGHFPIN